MKTWLAVCGLAASGAVVGVACAGKGSGGVIAVENPGDRGNHAQSAELRGGGLEQFQIFAGDINTNGQLGPPSVSPVPTGEFKIKAKKLPSSNEDQELTVIMKEIDPCVPYAKIESGKTLPLYVVRDASGKNLCAGATPQLVDEEELGACSGGNLHEKIVQYGSLAGLAVAVSGYWDEQGSHQAAEHVVTLSCISAVVAKCAHWGYLPWAKSDSTNLAGHHEACVHAARAAFGSVTTNGDMASPPTKTAYTCGSTLVDIFDHLTPPIQPQRNLYSRESYWNANGRMCMEKQRYTCGDVLTFPATTGNCNKTLEEGQWKIGVWSEANEISRHCPGKDPDACDYQ